MYIVTTHCDSDARAFVVVRRTRGLRDLLAHALAEHDVSHCSPGRCLIDPPGWTWWVGVPRCSLGDAIWRLGQWAFGRQDGILEVWRSEVGPQVLVECLGWDGAWLLDRGEE
jgi:hypothetical protein